jgi:hypothetical protein
MKALIRSLAGFVVALTLLLAGCRQANPTALGKAVGQASRPLASGQVATSGLTALRDGAEVGVQGSP